VPRKGTGYGLLRYLANAQTRAALEAIPAPEVCFNYLGQFDPVMPDSLFRLARDNRGTEHDPDEPNLYELDISGMVTEGKLVIAWTYSEQRYRRETVEHLAATFADALRALIDHCLSSEAGGYTPSDFADLDFDQNELDELLAQYESAQD
jgi:non-ribosomal peptide synthase protein (TIGR01720 family)